MVRRPILWGLLGCVTLLWTLGSGCVRYAYDSHSGGNSRGWRGDPMLDAPHQKRYRSQHQARRHYNNNDGWRRTPRRTYRRTYRRPYDPYLSRSYQQLFRYRQIIHYCRKNQQKTRNILQRLRGTMYDAPDVHEWRHYRRLQRRYVKFLRRYQRCIVRYRQRLAKLQTRIRSYASRHYRPRRNYHAYRSPWNPSLQQKRFAQPPPAQDPPAQDPSAQDPPAQDPPAAQPNTPDSPKQATPAPRRRPPSFPLYRPPGTTPPSGDNDQNLLAPPKDSGEDLSKPPPSDNSLGVQPPATAVKPPSPPSAVVVKPPTKQVPPDSVVRPNTDSAVPTFPPAQGDSQDIIRWKRFCAAETSKYPLMRAVRSLGTQSLKSNVKVKLYEHNTSASIKPIVGSGSRWVVLGNNMRYSQAHCHDRSFSLWDTQRQQLRSVKPAVTAYLLRHRHLLPWFLGKKHASADETIVSYNPRLGRGGIMFRVPMAALQKRYRYMYLVWNLKSNQITNAWTLGIPGCHSAYRPVGTDPSGRTFYYLQSEKAVDGSCQGNGSGGNKYFYRLMALDLASGNRRTLSRFAPATARLETVVPSRDFSRIAVVEYTEMARANGKAYVIDTRRGTIARFSAPVTPYGVVFSADLSSLLLYSSKAGMIVRVNLGNGQRTAVKTYRLGHAMGLSPDGKHLYVVFHSGVEVRDAETLKRVQFVSHRPMMGNAKFIHVDGSAVLGGTLFIKNGERLYIRRTP